jgi:hypothetical protein
MVKLIKSEKNTTKKLGTEQQKVQSFGKSSEVIP